MKTYRVKTWRDYGGSRMDYHFYISSEDLSKSFARFKENMLDIFNESLLRYFNKSCFEILVESGEVSIENIYIDLEEIKVDNLDRPRIERQ